MEEWANKVEEMKYDSKIPMQQVTVSTAETVAVEFFIKNFVDLGKPVLLVGMSGCGKTQLIKGILKGLNPDVFMDLKVNFNFYTDSALLQPIIEAVLEKKAGKQYGPPGKLKLI